MFEGICSSSKDQEKATKTNAFLLWVKVFAICMQQGSLSHCPSCNNRKPKVCLSQDLWNLYVHVGMVGSLVPNLDMTKISTCSMWSLFKCFQVVDYIFP